MVCIFESNNGFPVGVMRVDFECFQSAGVTAQTQHDVGELFFGRWFLAEYRAWVFRLCCLLFVHVMPNQCAPANRRPALLADGSGCYYERRHCRSASPAAVAVGSSSTFVQSSSD